MTESYVTYKSFYDAMEELTDEQYGRVMRAIDRYVYYGEETELSGIEKMAFTFMKPQIDANIKRKEYAEKGGRPVQKQTKAPKTPATAGAVIIEENTSVSLGYETEKPADTQTENLRICNQETLGYENVKPNVNDNANVNEKGNANYSAAPSAPFQYQDEQTQAAADEYQQAVYTEWIQQGLPLSSLSRQSFFNFQQQELRETLTEVLRHSAHTNEVVQAIKNAGAVKKLIDTGQSWQNTPVSFAGFWKNITQYLPGAFTITAFRRNDGSTRKTDPQRAPPAHTWTCPVCHHADNTSTICTRCQYEQNGSDTPEEWLSLLTERGRLPAHLQEVHA